MIRIDCPWCGPRDEAEFAYRGDATVRSPPVRASEQAFFDYVRARGVPPGWHVEWWQHVGGCRHVLQIVRNDTTHEVRNVAPAASDPGRTFPPGQGTGS
ncbi:MAG: sarcosine oxidase subunit delta [Thermomicrobiales bacterium]